ncbi:DUF5131 family protein [Microbispora sp. NPDC088329]|uniref:DUF5131 family protein n=1 Tax=Microbispora sp. NPDC088329 TaxID=3154869 RepID=UPI0034166ED2
MGDKSTSEKAQVTWNPAERLGMPFHRREPRRIIVSHPGDLFHESVSDGFIAQVWNVMGQCPHHIFQIATQHPERMRSWVKRWADTAADHSVPMVGGLPPMPRGPQAMRATYSSGRAQLFAAMLDQMGEPPEGCAFPTYDWMEGQRWWPGVLPNVWLGASVQDQRSADTRIPVLLDTPAAIRWISAEPLLGPLRLSAAWIDIPAGFRPVTTADILGIGLPNRLDWVVAGGQTGPDARPMHPDWARSLRDQCQAAGVAFRFEQWGEWEPIGPLYGDDEETDDAHMEAVAIEVHENRRVIQLESSGYIAEGHQPTDARTWLMAQVGARRAGRLLDGHLWDQYPAGVS